ncbi:MAG TPA: hypothetical protein PLD60_12510, partial [Leptospiraceae bacterium]|nr:hypothetical protein [Leptospiraceae bacterium]
MNIPASTRAFKLPAIVILSLAALTFFAAVRSMPVETSVFADGIGKWLQIRGLLTRGDFECAYQESVDPDFQFIPGPWYFYTIQNGKCSYGYQAAYALLAAPFFKIHPLGFLFLHFFLYLAMILGFMLCAHRLLPERSWAPWWAGIIAAWIIPTVVFAMDLSEVILSLAMGAWALALLCKRESFQSIEWKLPSFSEFKYFNSVIFASGIVLGLILSLRTESLIHGICWAFGLLLVQRKSFVSFASGYAVAILAVMGFHLWFFGNLMGNRGSSHAAVTAGLTASTHIGIARTLLLGGPLGLITSLPAIFLGLFAFSRHARKIHGPQILFMAVISILPTLGVLITAPSDGGYSWGPRFLSLTFAPYFLLVLLALDHPYAHRWPAMIVLAAIAAYGMQYTWKGRNVYRRAMVQNAGYAAYIESTSSEAIIGADYSLLAILSRSALQGHVYQARSIPEITILADRLKNAGVRRVILLRYATSEVTQLPGWTVKSRKSM